MHEKGNQFELNIFSPLHAALYIYTHKSEWREKCIYVAGRAQKSYSRRGVAESGAIIYMERAILPT